MKKFLPALLVMVAIAINTQAQDLPDYVSQEALIGWWPFNGNADDLSGNENHGTVMGGVVPAPNRFGQADSAYSFPGNLSSFIDVATNQGFDSLATGISVSAWYRTDAVSGDRRLLQIGNTDGGGKGLMMMLNAGEPWVARTHSGFTLTQAGRIGGWPTTVQSIKEEWTHIAFTVNFVNGQWRLYQNGVQVGQGATNNPIGYNPFSLGDLEFHIGLKVPNGFFETDAWLGEIDDIGIWSRVLNDCEVFDLFNAEQNSLQVDAGEDLFICPGNEVVLSAEANGIGGVTWNNNVIDGEPFTADSAGVFVATTSVGNCVVTDTLFIDFLEPTFSTDTLEACGEFTWVDGNTYSESNDSAVYVTTNAAGCDSIVTLNLTINQPSVVTDVVKACDLFTWGNGVTYTENNDTATLVLTNIHGCDSIVTLSLTIDQLQILQDPTDQTAVLTAGAEFTVDVSTFSPAYQWQSDFGDGFEDLTDGGQYAGVETATLSVSAVNFDNDLQPFRCVITGGACMDTTEVAFLSVCGFIDEQPLSQELELGEDLVLSVTSNDLTASYQWQSNIGFGFQNLSDAGQYSGVNTPELTVSNVNQTNDNQLFRCVVTTGSCVLESDEATLTIGTGIFVTEQNEHAFAVWPNPVVAVLSIEVGSGFIGAPYLVFDLNGRMVRTGQILSTRTDLDLSDLAPGMYLIQAGETQRRTLRIVKQ